MTAPALQNRRVLLGSHCLSFIGRPIELPLFPVDLEMSQ